MDAKEKARLAIPLIVMICAALVVVVSLIGVMYYNNYDNPHAVPVAHGRGN